MTPTDTRQAAIITVRPADEVLSRQHLPYFVGISAGTASAD